MSNVGSGRARLFLGAVLLAAALLVCATAFFMSPHQPRPEAEGVEHLRRVVITFVRNAAAGTLVLTGLAAWLLAPLRRLRRPPWDNLIIALIVALVLASVGQLIWVELFVLR